MPHERNPTAAEKKVAGLLRIPPEDVRPTAGDKKVAKLLRFPPEDVRKLKAAAQQMGVSETTYALLALRAQFRRDHIE